MVCILLKRVRKRKKTKRFVLGTGEIWFSTRKDGHYHSVTLVKETSKSTKMVPLKLHGLGAYNKVRLIAEVIK